MTIDLSELNDNQLQATLWNDGPMLVLASPGSGKTRVLTTRVARILEDQPDASVLALTFTNKAAAEMRERVDALLGQRAEYACLATFHAYAVQVLRQHGSHLGINPSFSLLTQEEDRLAQLEPVAAQLAKEGHETPADRHALLRLLDHLFRDAYDIDQPVPSLTIPHTWIAALFSRYCASLVSTNRQDFGSLLYFARQLLRETPGVARVLRREWSYVCVDEFQDTNKAQYELLKLLVPPPKPNLFVVGDEDQIIYQWNGASPGRLSTLRSDYDIKLVQLPDNYRCPREIVVLANRLIRHNTQRTPEKLPIETRRPQSGPDCVVKFCFQFDDPVGEANSIAEDIFERGRDAADCVVLARTTKLLEGAVLALRQKGIPAYLAEAKSDFETPPVRVVLLALRLANARHDREILRRLCVAWEALTGSVVEVESVVACSTLMGGDFLRAWVGTVQASSPETSCLLKKLREWLVDALVFPDILTWFLYDSWKEWECFFDGIQEEIDTWRVFHEEHLSEYTAANTTLHGYLQSIDMYAKVPPAPPGSVRCLTIHGAKGLEFKHVYLMGLAQDVLPSYFALKNGANCREVEEERRNCYVAITRSQETLTLTCAKQYNGYTKQMSQFIAEMAIDVRPSL